MTVDDNLFDVPPLFVRHEGVPGERSGVFRATVGFGGRVFEANLCYDGGELVVIEDGDEEGLVFADPRGAGEGQSWAD